MADFLLSEPSQRLPLNQKMGGLEINPMEQGRRNPRHGNGSLRYEESFNAKDR